MDEKLFSVLIGVVSGAVGYWVVTFWMKPILHFVELRAKILSDLIYFAQVINADELNDRMQKLFKERVDSNRRNSADLTACFLELPYWYKTWLKFRGCDLVAVSSHLIGFSNTTDYDVAAKQAEKIKKALCINSEVV